MARQLVIWPINAKARVDDESPRLPLENSQHHRNSSAISASGNAFSRDATGAHSTPKEAVHATADQRHRVVVPGCLAPACAAFPPDGVRARWVTRPATVQWRSARPEECGPASSWVGGARRREVR